MEVCKYDNLIYIQYKTLYFYTQELMSFELVFLTMNKNIFIHKHKQIYCMFKK